jgi:hypothetical protein
MEPEDRPTSEPEEWTTDEMVVHVISLDQTTGKVIEDLVVVCIDDEEQLMKDASSTEDPPS